MANDASQLRRFSVDYFEGVNTLVGHNLSKKQEFEHCENARSQTIGTIEKRQGYRRLGSDLSATANYGLTFFDDSNASSKGMYRVSTVGGTTSVYYLNTSDVWTALAVSGTNLTAAMCSFVQAEGNLFFVNGTDANRYVAADGITVTTSSSGTGHLYNSPVANKINFYKDRLYLGDYTATTRYKTGIMRSSVPLGIVALVDGDFAATDCEANDWITVTDTKYIYATDILDIYRGGTKIADVTVKAKTETSFQINAITFASGTTLSSADELWVDGTYTGAKLFRWADNPRSGIDVKQYDTFKLTGADNDPLTMLTNIGDVQVIANKNNMGIWNNYTLYNLDLGIGCVSKQGYVKALGTLFFIHYTGIYATTGGTPKLISAKIEKYITGSTTAGLEASAAGRKGYSIFFSLGTVTLYKPDGSTDKSLTNVVLEYNLRQENWYVHTGIAAVYFATYTTATDPDRLEFATTNDEVFEFLYGTMENNANEIPFRVDLFPIYLAKNFENLAYLREIIIETERGSGIKCFISLDGEPFYEIQGEAVKGTTILKVTSRSEDENQPPRCQQLRISLRDYSKRLCKISRIAIVYSDSLEEEEFRPQYP